MTFSISSRSPRSILATLFVAATSFSTLASAQQGQSVLDTSKLPSCASSCAVLTAANGQCVPPIAPVTNQGAYQSCFCAMPSLSALYSSPNDICSGTCSSSDRTTIQQWYIKLCTGGKVVTPGASTKTAPASTRTGAAQTGAQTTGANAQETGTQSSSTSSSSDKGPPKSWISNHWPWVLLLIILFLAFLIGLVGGFWLKRRIRRNRDPHRYSTPGLPNSNPSPMGSGALAAAHAGSQRNHPQMTVVPGAGSEAAMARYDGSGVSTLDGRRSRAMSAAYDIADGYNSEKGRARDSIAVPSPPPTTAGANRGSHRYSLRHQPIFDEEDVNPVAPVPGEGRPLTPRRPSVEEPQSRVGGLKNKLRRHK